VPQAVANHDSSPQNFMKRKSLLILPLLALASTTHAATIAQWNFNSTTPDGNVATGILTPNIGSGTATLVGGTTSTFASGDTSGGSSDPATGDDSARNLTTFATQATGDLSRGAEFLVSTVGFTDIEISFDLRFSNTASRHAAVQYTTDGTTWTTAGFVNATSGDTWFNGNTFDLSAVSAADNNANFGIRVVSAFQSTATGAGAAQYFPANPGSSYGTTGTWRFDMVTVKSIPEPSAALLGGLGLLALLRRRR
jgi:hypothetical protein